MSEVEKSWEVIGVQRGVATFWKSVMLVFARTGVVTFSLFSSVRHPERQ